MAYFDPQRQTKLKTDAGPQGIAATMKQYDPQAKRWRPVTYRSRALTDTETRHAQLEKEAKAVEWGVFSNQIYLYGLRDTFDTDHKPLVPLFASHKTTAPLRIERMRVRLQGFNYDSIMWQARRLEQRPMKQTTTPDTQSRLRRKTTLQTTGQNGRLVMQRKYLRRISWQ